MTVSRFLLPLVRQGCATCPPRLGLAAGAGGAGLLVGSTGLRRWRALVSGPSGTSRYICRESGEVSGCVLVPVHHERAVIAVEDSDVQRQLGFHRAARRAGLGRWIP